MSLTLSQRSNSYNYYPANYVDQENSCGLTPGEWRNYDSSNGLIPIARTGSNNYSRTAKQVRDDFKDYFMNEGAVDWQWATVTRTGNS